MEALVHPYLDGLIERLKSAGAVSSESVERAMRMVQRHRFLERFFGTGPGGTPPYEQHVIDPLNPSSEHLELVYSDEALCTRLENGMPSSSTSQPSLVARMLELLELTPGARVLEIGTGTGYNAALLAELVGDHGLVATVDIQPDVVLQSRRLLDGAGYERVRVLERDGYEGLPEDAPFDRIVVTIGCPDVSPRWPQQLAPDGFALIPLEHVGLHPLMRVWREGDVVQGTIVGMSGFMQVKGELTHDGLWPRSMWLLDFATETDMRPVWPGLQNEDYEHFAYFMGLSDRRACASFYPAKTIGLISEQGGHVLVRDGEIKLFGLGAGKTLADLRHAFEEWTSLGQPRMSDYQTVFLRQGMVEHRCRWRIERKFFGSSRESVGGFG